DHGPTAAGCGRRAIALRGTSADWGAAPVALGRGKPPTRGRSGMSDNRVRVLLIMLMAVVALALGETALAKGMKQTGRVEGTWAELALAILRNGWVLAGSVLLVMHLGLYLLVLRRADLSFALPLTAASYLLSALLARFYLHEDVGASRWIGTLLITAGVAI